MSTLNEKFTIVKNTLLEDTNLTVYDKLVYVILNKFANNKTRQCYPSMNTISKYVGASRPTISKSIKRLEELNYIKVDKTVKGTKTFNLYTILDGLNEVNIGDSDVNDVYTCKEHLHGDVNDVYTNYNNKNYTNKKTLSKDKGETSFASQKTLIDIPKPLASKPKKKKHMTHREIGLTKIKDARNGLVSWEDVTYRDFTYYYIEKHNEKMKKKISFNRYESVSIIRDSFIKSFNIPKERVCEYIDKLLDIYSDSPMAWDCLSFNMIRNNHPMMKDLMLRVETSLNEPKKEELTQEELEKQLQYHREIQAKIEAGTAVLGVDYF